MFLGPETKERGVVAGVRSFVEGIKAKEWQGSTCDILVTIGVEGDLNSLSLQIQKPVLELVALIGIGEGDVTDLDKYPMRTFAISGSSAEIAYPALRVFVKEHVIRKMGVLIPLEVVSRLHIINGGFFNIYANTDMPVSEDLKRGRFGDAMKDIVAEKAQIIRLLISLLTE
jgi:hypothetical protein